MRGKHSSEAGLNEGSEGHYLNEKAEVGFLNSGSCNAFNSTTSDDRRRAACQSEESWSRTYGPSNDAAKLLIELHFPSGNERRFSLSLHNNAGELRNAV